MIILNYKCYFDLTRLRALVALALLGLLTGCLPPPATGEMHTVAAMDNTPILADMRVAQRAKDAALNVGTKPAPAAGDTHEVSLGSISMRAVAQRLDRIELWRDDASGAINRAVWDGVDPKDTPAILHSLVGSKQEEVKKVTLRLAMSAVYTPEGMDAMDYVRWRAAVLAADKKYTEAARLLNVARIGRDSNSDLVARITYELASNQAESACVEAMAAGRAGETPFWQGMQVLCAWQAGDVDAAAQMQDVIADEDISAAAEKLNNKNADMKPLIAALVNASGALPLAEPLPDNSELIEKLKRLLSDIKDADDSTVAAKNNQGELLLLSLGALAAETRDDDTQSVTSEALKKVGF